MATGAEGNLFVDAVVILGGAVVMAPIFKRMGLGTVLGYLATGILLGPVLNLYREEGEEILHFAEIGVVFLLFLIGLELKPSRLWDMRRDIFGLGASQVVLTGAVLGSLAYVYGFDWRGAAVVGAGLALSSTAFAMQVMEDRGVLRTGFGQRAFAILLFQDLAIVPLLVAVPLLAAGTMEMGPNAWWTAAKAVGAVAGLVLVGRFILDRLFHVIATTGAREAMIAAALLIVLGSAVLMQFVGLSMAMGAFLAGVLLAESSYRHELEADIEPFRGIFLGLFFVAVGLSVDLRVVWDNLFLLALAVPLLLAVKSVILYWLARAFGSDHNASARISAILPQHGEFGFVLFSAALAAGLLTSDQSSVLIAAVTISMAATPVVVMIGERLVSAPPRDEEPEESFEDVSTDVLMIGFSRIGQIVAQTLLTGGVDVTVIDNDPERIRQASRFGFRIYFGDGARKDVLHAAGIEDAKLVVVATGTVENTNRVVDILRDEFPSKPLYVRSYDRTHSLDLIKRDVTFELRETFESAIVLGCEILQGVGFRRDEAEAIVDDVRRRDRKRLEEQASEGVMAGRGWMHTEPQTPAPLLEPVRKARAIGEESREVLSQQDAAE